MAPYVHVVTDLHQVVEFDAVFDDRVAQCTTVDAGVGTNLHVVADAHSAQLLDLDPGTFFRRKAKAIGPDHGTGMHDATRTDMAVFAHGDARFEPSVGANVCTPLNHAQRADAGAGVHHGIGVHHGARVHARLHRRCVLALPPLGGAGEVHIGVVRHDAGTALQCRLAHRRGHNDTGRLGGGQLLLVARVAEETQILRPRSLQRGQACDQLVRVSFERAAQCLDELAQSHTHAAPIHFRQTLLGCTIEGLDHLVGDVVLRVDVHRLQSTMMSYFSCSASCLTTG
jgi:hypothetical protein